MKKVLYLSLLTFLMLNGTANAAQITNVAVSDFENSVVTVSGTAEEENVSIVLIKQGETLDFKEYAEADDVSIQSVKSSDGKFEVSFKFEGSDGNYELYATDSETSYPFEFISKKTIENLVSDLGDKKIEKDEIFGNLEKYGKNMGIDISYATDEKTKEYLAANMLLYADRIKENDISGVAEIVDLTKAELEFMNKLKETLVASGVNGLFEDYKTSAEIDLTEYDMLDDTTQKPKVCGDFIGKEYFDMAVFRADFKESVKNAGSSSGGSSSSSGSSSSGSSSSGSSSGGSSSGGSSSSGKGGGSVGAVYYPSDAVVNPSNPETPKKEKILEAYEDIENVSWAWDAILYSYENGIMNGASEKKFMPDDEVKREQLAKIVTLAFGFYDETAECDFGDVEKSDWAYAYIASAKNNGLMQGTSETEFGYGESVSREDLCLTLYRAALKVGYTFTKTNTEFCDFINVSDYAAEAVAHLAGEGIVNGVGNDKFAPQDTASRAQVAQIIYKIMN